MRVKLGILCAITITLSSCQHLNSLFTPLLLLKAVVQGHVKGVVINCEKVVSTQAQWRIMCTIGDDIAIHYRTKRLDAENTQLEVMIGKTKGDRRKIIAEPVMVVSKNQPALFETVSTKNQLTIRAEHIR